MSLSGRAMLMWQPPKNKFGQAIDMIAGPSEILVVADQENDPAWMR